MKKTKLLAAMVVGIAAILCGCEKKVQETGFLSTYKNLEPVSDNRMRYISPEVGGYWKFVIDPISVQLYDENTGKKIDPDSASHIEQYLYSQIVRQKPDRYQIVPEAGPAVARLRIAISNAEKSNAALTALPHAKLAGMDLGQVWAELELTNSLGGTQLAAAVDCEAGSRLLSVLSNRGEVETVMKDWAKKIWLRVDELHGFHAQ